MQNYRENRRGNDILSMPPPEKPSLAREQELFSVFVFPSVFVVLLNFEILSNSIVSAEFLSRICGGEWPGNFHQRTKIASRTTL